MKRKISACQTRLFSRSRTLEVGRSEGEISQCTGKHPKQETKEK